MKNHQRGPIYIIGEHYEEMHVLYLLGENEALNYKHSYFLILYTIVLNIIVGAPSQCTTEGGDCYYLH